MKVKKTIINNEFNRDLSQNNIEGQIPSEFEKLTNLQFLYVFFSSFIRK